MPLIILGIIVVVGGAILALSHFKPDIGRRLRGGYGGFGFGGFDRFGAMQDGNGFKMPFDEDPSAQPPAGGENTGEVTPNHEGRSDDGKVLFIFGSGEREERSLNEDDNKDE